MFRTRNERRCDRSRRRRNHVGVGVGQRGAQSVARARVDVPVLDVALAFSLYVPVGIIPVRILSLLETAGCLGQSRNARAQLHEKVVILTNRAVILCIGGGGQTCIRQRCKKNTHDTVPECGCFAPRLPYDRVLEGSE